MSSRTRVVATLAASHALNDLIAGWLLASYWISASASAALAAFAVYNVIAFGGQALAARWIERTRDPRRALEVSLALMCGALVAARLDLLAALVLSGLASSLVHVAGGVLSLQQPRGDHALGWFCAPGVVGLTLGGWLGHGYGAPPLWTAVVAAAMFGACLGVPRRTSVESDRKNVLELEPSAPLRARDGVVLLVLVALVLRSVVWDVVQAARADDVRAVAALAAAAALGKLLGGVFIERSRSVRALATLLLGACALLDLFGHTLLVACAGVALLQATIPIAIVWLHRALRLPAPHAVAFGLGITVVLGGLVSFVMPADVALRALLGLALLLVGSDGLRAARGRSGAIEIASRS